MKSKNLTTVGLLGLGGVLLKNSLSINGESKQIRIEDYKIAVIYNGYDKEADNISKLAVRKISNELNWGVIEKKISQNNIFIMEEELEIIIKQNPTIILCIGKNYNNALRKLVDKHSNIYFIAIDVGDNLFSSVPKNIYQTSYNLAKIETSFLMGIIAAKVSGDNSKIGFIGLKDDGFSNKCLDAYITGVKYINNNKNPIVKNIKYQIDDKSNKDSVIKIVRELIDESCSVIYEVIDMNGSDPRLSRIVHDEVRKNEFIYSMGISYYNDMKFYKNSMLASISKSPNNNIINLIFNQAQKIESNEFKNINENLGIKYLNHNYNILISKSTINEVQKAKKYIENGGIIIVPNKNCNEINNLYGGIIESKHIIQDYDIGDPYRGSLIDIHNNYILYNLKNKYNRSDSGRFYLELMGEKYKTGVGNYIEKKYVHAIMMFELEKEKEKEKGKLYLVNRVFLYEQNRTPSSTKYVYEIHGNIDKKKQEIEVIKLDEELTNIDIETIRNTLLKTKKSFSISEIEASYSTKEYLKILELTIDTTNSKTIDYIKKGEEIYIVNEENDSIAKFSLIGFTEGYEKLMETIIPV